MSTPEQIAQNRKNAQSSTGPKTPEGKAKSSQNAVKHGFFAKNDVISGEDLAFYEAHRQDIYDEYAPLTPTESVLTQRIASLTWRLMRADRLQTTTINTLVAAQQKATPQPVRETINIPAMIAELRRKDKDPEYALNTAGIILAGLVRYDREPVTTDPTLDAAMSNAFNHPGTTHICEAETQLGTVIYNDFHGSAVIERLQGYEQKIENSLIKTIRLFHQLQQLRTKQDAARDKRACQYLRQEQVGWGSPHREHHDCENEPNPRTAGVSPASPPQNAQNEPNSDLTSISEITYNRSRYAKAKRNEPNQPQTQNPDDHPGPIRQVNSSPPKA